ncbi:Putative alpha-L-fucosidase [Gryllus bimaculatus]|nr:Putative alpha-L-fucosidase [Gryllus bimaculatus]
MFTVKGDQGGCTSDDVQHHTVLAHYRATWQDLDTRPSPTWYDEAKFGIMVHWGLFSVPGFGSELFRRGNESEYISYMKKHFSSNFTYEDYKKLFTVKHYEPREWAKRFESSGAKYVILTSKHHDGFTMWPSKYGVLDSWLIVPRHDLLREFANAIRSKRTMEFGIYYSLFEWFNLHYQLDVQSAFKTDKYVTQKMLPDLRHLVKEYEPAIIWADGDLQADDNYWKSKQFLSWLYNHSPVRNKVVVNDRWGKNCRGKHGDFHSYVSMKNYVNAELHKWERAMSIDKKSWIFRRNSVKSDFRSTYKILLELVRVVSSGGNFLLNIAPTRLGAIPEIVQQRLLNIGSWFKKNGVAIYSTKPWKTEKDCITPGVWYTSKSDKTVGTTVFALVEDWPANNTLRLGAPQLANDSIITLLNTGKQLSWKYKMPGIEIFFPRNSKQVLTIWTLQMSHVIDNFCDLKYHKAKVGF